MSYTGRIDVDTVDIQSGLMDLRTGLARTNWYLRMLGLPADQRKAISQMLQVIRTLRALQMIVTATSVTSGALSVMRIAGLGKYGKVVRDASRLVNAQ